MPASDVSPEVKAIILEEIKTHIRVHGRKDWGRLAERFPDIIGTLGDDDNRTRRFRRWVASVSDGAATPLTEAVKTAREMTARNLPVAPPPSYIAKNGADAAKNLDFLEEIKTVWSDVMAVRAWSITEEPGSPMKIKNPVYLDISIKRRLDVMETALRIMQEVWDLQRMEDIYAEITSIISEVMAPYPEAQREAMRRIKGVNDKRAVNVHAEPRQ